MTGISMVVSDLDGTFLGADGHPSPENVAAILAAAERGVGITFATGRAARMIHSLDQVHPARPHMITSNGAVILDPVTREVVRTFPMAAEVVLAVAEAVRAEVPDAAFAIEYAGGWAHEPGYVLAKGPASQVAPLPDLLARHEAVKLLLISPTLDTETLAARALPLIEPLLTATWSYIAAVGLLELSAPGVHKGAAVAALLAELSLDPSTVAAFGDMPNDLTMLQLVGHPYAMSDAHPLLRAEGFPEAGPHDESGVGRTVRALLGI